MKASWTFSLIYFIALLVSPNTFALDQKQSQELIIQSNKVYDPDKISIDSLQEYEKKFDFDWNDYSTVSANQTKINAIENFLKTNPDLSKLNIADKKSLGRILFKLSTYYIHITREIDLAIDHLNNASKYLKDHEDVNRINNQLAYAHAIKFSLSRKNDDKQKALILSNKVLNQSNNSFEKAFGYFVRGKIEGDANNFGHAEDNLKKSLQIYAKTSSNKKDQYARAKNLLASTILNINGREREAVKMLEETHQYWVKKGNIEKNIYAARNLVTLGEAYYKIGYIDAAQKEVNAAIPTLEQLYGEKSQWLIGPYQLMSEAYRQSGDTKHSEEFQSKLKQISKNYL